MFETITVMLPPEIMVSLRVKLYYPGVHRSVNAARKSACATLPCKHGVFEQAGQFLGAGRARRKLSYAMLRQRALDELGDVGGRVADLAQPVGCLQALHKPGDALG